MAFISSFNLYSKEEIGANRWPITLPILYISKIKKYFPVMKGLIVYWFLLSLPLLLEIMETSC